MKMSMKKKIIYLLTDAEVMQSVLVQNHLQGNQF
jgi:hypothetical protein